MKNIIHPQLSQFQEQRLPGGNGHLEGLLKINQIAYVGAHNSPCSKSLGWIYAQQRVCLKDQIEKHGARFFKINLHWFLPDNGFCGCCNSKGNTKNTSYIAIAHEPDGKKNCKLSIICRGFSYPQKAVVVFKQLADIFRCYPQEVFIIKLEGYLFNQKSVENGAKNFTEQMIQQAYDNLIGESGMKELIYQAPFNYSNIPTLNDLRQGRNIILFADECQLFVDNDVVRMHFKPADEHICQNNWDDDPLSFTFSPELARFQKDPQGQIIVKELLKNLKNIFFEAHYYKAASFSFLSYGKKFNSKKHVKERYQHLCDYYRRRVNFICADYIDEGELARSVDEINNEAIKEMKANGQLQLDHEIQTAFVSPKQVQDDKLLMSGGNQRIQMMESGPQSQDQDQGEQVPLKQTNLQQEVY